MGRVPMPKFSAKKALAEGVRMILLTRDEILALADSDELVRTVKRKLCELIVSGTVWP